MSNKQYQYQYIYRCSNDHINIYNCRCPINHINTDIYRCPIDHIDIDNCKCWINNININFLRCLIENIDIDNYWCPIDNININIYRCPIPGCDGSGHSTGKFLSHRRFFSFYHFVNIHIKTYILSQKDDIQQSFLKESISTCQLINSTRMQFQIFPALFLW